jgi:tRNA dimethylallyltransferase
LNQKTLVVITGPTAVGKTTLCVDIAKHFGTEIISADSRQLYKELAIGTAKPTKEEMNGIPHHFVNSHSINENFNVNDFEKEALKILEQLFQKHNVVLLTGGSGLFIDILCNGFDEEIPTSSIKIREEINSLYNKYGITVLQEKLKQLDPQFYKEIDLNNYKRLERAIEICLLTGKPNSELRQGIKQKRPFNILKIGLERDREELFSRINDRVDIMTKGGLLDEVKSVETYKNHNALKTVGYTELFSFLEDELSLKEAIEKIKVNSRRYAKRQIAWFTKSGDYKWFHPDNKDAILTFIKNKITSS